MAEAGTGARVTVGELLARRGVDASPYRPGTRWSAVLAIGSNAGVSQLARKYASGVFPGGAVIPVVRSVLEGFDSVYAPLVAGYGSVTATLERCEGASLGLFVTYLTERQLGRMNETEGGYHLLRLRGVALHVGTSLEARRAGREPAGAATEVLQYNHRRGTLWLPAGRGGADTPVALAELPCDGRAFPALAQGQAQELVRALASPGGGGGGAAGRVREWVAGGAPEGGLAAAGELREWIAANVRDEGARAAVRGRLERLARPLAYDGVDVLASIDGVAAPGAKATVTRTGARAEP